jgi:predicted 2-oxoglutarate/Fe(II)-dependent dioxygenase YbiX
MSHELVNFLVGGVPYTIHKRDIEKYPESFLSVAVKKEWHDGKRPIAVDRDGELFHHVYAYIVSSCLSKTVNQSNDKDLLEAICREAEFFGLPGLARECSTDEVVAPFRNYKTIRSYVESDAKYGGGLCVNSPSSFTTPLLKALGSLWAPFCVKGEISMIRDCKLLKSSTIAKLNLTQLVSAAVPSSFGHGTDTVFNAKVRDSLEIPASRLDAAGLRSIAVQFSWKLSELCPNTPVRVEPYKLVIYKKGGHFDQHRDTVRGEGHIGTIVVILNSKYTGGELEITHGDKTEVVTGPYNWVAMYGDCLHKINPVKSGTRVSLIYDIYAKGAVTQCEEAKGDADTAQQSGDMTCSRGGSEGSSEGESYQEDSIFWRRYCHDALPDIDETRMRGPDTVAIHAALNKELKKYDSVVICLQHLYPACQAVPGFLKGADAVLYEVLQGHYEVQVVYCSVFHCDAAEEDDQGFIDDNHEHEEVSAKLFTSFEEEGGECTGKVKVVIPSQLDYDRLLDYSPYLQYTGNESQAGETMYLVTGLHVRRLE